ALFRLHVDDKLIAGQMVDIGVTKEDEWSALELDGNFSVTARHPLTCAEINGNAGPAPVINAELERDKGFSAGCRIHACFLPVSRKALAFGSVPGPILSTDAIMDYVFCAHWTNGMQHLRLFVAYRIGCEGDGRLHRSESNQLHDVVGHHVT